ncbi:MAG: hypothetical protein Q9201_000739 [Fulgogasparrea decipioides]
MAYLANGAPGSYMEVSATACLNCRAKKRKCDMLMTGCMGCKRKSTLLDSEQSSKQPAFPPFFFLDYSIFQYHQQQIPKISIPLPRQVLDATQDPYLVARQYFLHIHPFFPFISKKRFFDSLPIFPARPDVDVTILLFCMKLIVRPPKDDPLDKNGRPLPYLTVKRTLAEADIAGAFSFQTLQALILVSLYELAHAIFPAAYLSVGTCARYATALGIDTYTTMNPSDTAETLLVQEEMRRAWWAIVVLDR